MGDWIGAGNGTAREWGEGNSRHGEEQEGDRRKGVGRRPENTEGKVKKKMKLTSELSSQK